MKRSLAVLLCFACVLLPLAGMAEVLYVTTASGSSVHLREGPSTDAAILDTVGYGQAVEVVEMILGSAWIHVSHNGNYGYMMLRYLSEEPPGPVPTPVPKPTAAPPQPRPTASTLEQTLSRLFAGFSPANYEAVVVPSTPTTYVNLRWAPSKSAPVRLQYWAGTQLQVLTQDGTWSEVYDPLMGMHGFMMSQFLTPVSYGADGNAS